MHKYMTFIYSTSHLQVIIYPVSDRNYIKYIEIKKSGQIKKLD